MKQEIILTAQTNDLTVREGKALELKEPLKIEIYGDINTVASFLKVRSSQEDLPGLQSIDINKAVVIVDKAAMTIELSLDPQNYYGAKVKGSIELSDELQQFFINKTKLFTREELIKLIKFSRLLFADTELHAKLLAAYQTFKASANVDMTASNDTRGNKNNSFDKKVTTDLPDSFVLNVPIFKGQEKKSFRVEICLDVTDGGGRFWFESVELNDLIEIEKEVIISKQIESCKDLVVIYK